MRRALIALFLSPLVASASLFGLLAVVAYPFMLAVTLCVALPLFLFLQRRKSLEWWHAVLAGSFCGACFVAVDTLLSYAPDLDRLVSSNNVFYVALGAGTALLFWLTGIFRNQAFPFVGRSFPISFLIIVPLAALIVFVHQKLEPALHQGRVLAVLVEPTVTPRAGQASVRLSTGTRVQADLSNTWPRSMVVGHCFHMMERWSTLRLRRVYELTVPFGGGVDDC